jgi:NADH dehydrogenase FAD-containing subunit
VWPYNDRGFIEVNDSLQTTWNPYIFAAGDVTEIYPGVGIAATTQASGAYGTKSRLSAVRNAHLAESQAELVAMNILRLNNNMYGTSGKNLSLLSYPETPFYGSQVTPLLACVSLGPKNGVVVFNDIVIGGALIGIFGALIKFIIERSKIAEIRQKTWGRVFWAAGHVAVNTVHRAFFSIRALIFRTPASMRALAKALFATFLALTGISWVRSLIVKRF